MALQSGLISASAKAHAPVPAGLILALMILFLTLCLVMTAVRMYTRLVVHKKTWLDDCEYWDDCTCAKSQARDFRC